MGQDAACGSMAVTWVLGTTSLAWLFPPLVWPAAPDREGESVGDRVRGSSWSWFQVGNEIDL